MTIEIAIVVVGLAVVAASVVLAWFKKGPEVWASFAFGFLLVLIASPVGSKLSSFSLSGGKLEVSFKEAALTEEQKGKLTESARLALPVLAPGSPAPTNQAQAKSMDTASRKIQSDLAAYITSLGYIPSQLIGTEFLAPGYIVSIQQGRPVTWATQSEAFPKLQTTTSPLAFPRFAIEQSVPLPGNSKPTMIAVDFWCSKDAQTIEASLNGLSQAFDEKLLRRMAQESDLYVVQAVLQCRGFKLASKLAKPTPAGGDQESFLYEPQGAEPIVLGYRLARVTRPAG
jgi:hypothetical protein